MVTGALAGAWTEIASFPDQAAALEHTIATMRQLARMGAHHAAVRGLALGAVSRCAPRDGACEVEQLARVVRRLRYTPDPRWADHVSAPEYTLEVGGGDCDDLAVVFAALCLATGRRCAFLLGSARAPMPTHVLAAAAVGGRWVPVETSSRSLPVGRLPRGFRLMRVEEVR